jgi:outer membrane protein assembly factor BamD
MPWYRALAVALMLAGCAGGGSQGANLGEDAPDTDDETFDDGVGSVSRGRGESAVSVSYAKTAKGNWARGEAEYEDESFLAAQKYYAYIRAKFPYSAYAIRSELRIADCLFERSRYLEAIDAYRNFSRLHPTHKKVAYAAYRSGAAYYEQIPGDWFMIPPAHEKDQAAVRDAERALRAYVEKYPKDDNISEGTALLREVRLKLAAHERYAADFYDNIDKPLARLGRLQILRTQFADVSLDAALLLEIIEVQLELDQLKEAQAVETEFSAKFPNSSELRRARDLIGRRSQTASPIRQKQTPSLPLCSWRCSPA